MFTIVNIFQILNVIHGFFFALCYSDPDRKSVYFYVRENLRHYPLVEICVIETSRTSLQSTPR